MSIFLGVMSVLFLIAAIAPHPAPREKSEREKALQDLCQLGLGVAFGLIALGVWE